MTSLATNNLASLIRKKHQVLVQLRNIGRKQCELADEAHAAPLLQLIGAKQHLINALELIERNLRPYQAEDPESRVWRSDADRAHCAQQSQECNALLAEVMELEKQQEQRMVDRRNEVAEQLKQSGASRDAASAYHNHSRPQPLKARPTSGSAVPPPSLGHSPSTGLDLTSDVS